MSASRNLRLEFILQAVDRVTKPVRAMLGSNNELARAIKGTRDQLKELNRAQASIDSFRKLNKDAAITGNQLQAVQRRTKELAQQMSQVAQPTAAMTRAFEAAKREAQALKQRQGELQQNTHAVRTRLADMGISTQALAQHQRELRQQLTGTNQQLEAQQQRLATVAAQQRRVDAARQTAGRIQARRAGWLLRVQAPPRPGLPPASRSTRVSAKPSTMRWNRPVCAPSDWESRSRGTRSSLPPA